MKIAAIPASSPVDKIMDFLLHAPDDEVFTFEELQEKLDLGRPVIEGCRNRDKRVKALSAMNNRHRYFGSPKAIAKLKEKWEQAKSGKR
jgi:hypothetical protein